MQMRVAVSAKALRVASFVSISLARLDVCIFCVLGWHSLQPREMTNLILVRSAAFARLCLCPTGFAFTQLIRIMHSAFYAVQSHVSLRQTPVLPTCIMQMCNGYRQNSFFSWEYET
jgi:hypothetical protein